MSWEVRQQLRGSCFDEGGIYRGRTAKRRDTSARIDRVREHWRPGVHCAYCHRWLSGAEVTVDHIVPMAWGGSRSMDNYAPSCERCQRTKRDRFVQHVCWPCIAQTKRLVLASLAAGRCAWTLVLERKMPVGVLVFNEAIDRVATEDGFEPFGHIKPWWTLPQPSFQEPA